MKEMLEKIRSDFEVKIAAAETLAEIEELRVGYLGKKGELTLVLRGMGKLAPEERPVVGQMVNTIREYMETELGTKLTAIKSAESLKR